MSGRGTTTSRTSSRAMLLFGVEDTSLVLTHEGCISFECSRHRAQSRTRDRCTVNDPSDCRPVLVKLVSAVRDHFANSFYPAPEGRHLDDEDIVCRADADASFCGNLLFLKRSALVIIVFRIHVATNLWKLQ